tara:strand:- start:180 stop:344 length:165 start_codon:yes stop_codon:yes gene_type:complete
VVARYLAGSKNPRAKAKEIKATQKAYREGRSINVKEVSAFRAAQAKRKKKEGKK